MSRRAPSTSLSRPASRAPSLAGGSRLKPTASTINRGGDRRATSHSTQQQQIHGVGVHIPSDIPETNINVVVRCRGRSGQEIAEGSPVITRTDGPLSDSITIESGSAAASSTVSALSVAATAAAGAGGPQPDTKTYAFHKVFGPEADQSMVFDEVADNMLDEVLNGFNCTVFAYGQTGTGKTYTMQGDLTPTPLMTPSTDAGIIPRVLHKLFSVLEAGTGTGGGEYAVKCSYLELYNEELRDLLAPEYVTYAAPAVPIKIFEDASKKGVNVTGVEERGIANLKEGLAALQQGSARRATAETRMNSESSRSHSIFTLTVMVKETSEKGGEDLLRTGKFNLVDLAGSEAIGRSGAENKRAREAGMINQSLLTLGRVISALVDKSAHIPYRESKLTRLLQDSLGGRTKTTIVATVSPTRSNMEETLSTLDYALRAKSIKNKPEVNAHLTKAGLLREYVADIERLKQELYCTREKNGVHVPEEQWERMQKSSQQLAGEHREATMRARQVEVLLTTKKKEFDELMARWVSTEEDLRGAREAGEQLSDALAAARTARLEAESLAEEERVVAAAFARGEERLHDIATVLSTAAADGERDADGLLDKVGRMRDVVQHNAGSAGAFGAEMRRHAAELARAMRELHAVQTGFAGVLRGDLEAAAKRGEEESRKHMAELDGSFEAFDDLAAKLSKSVQEGKADASDSLAAILSAKDQLKSSIQDWAAIHAKQSASIVDDLCAQQARHLDTVNTSLDTTSQLLASVFEITQEALSAQESAFATARQLASDVTSAEIGRLEEERDRLTAALDNERARGAKQADGVVRSVMALMADFTASQDSAMRDIAASVATGTDDGVGRLARFADLHEEAVNAAESAAESARGELERRGREAEVQRAAARKALRDAATGTRTAFQKYAAESGSRARDTADEMGDVLGGVQEVAERFSTNADARAKTQSHLLGTLQGNSIDAYELSNQRVRTSAADMARLTSTLLASHAETNEISSSALDTAQTKLSAMSSAAQHFFDTMRAEEPTGETPRKRTWDHVPHSWERTLPKDVLVARHRAGMDLGAASGSATASALGSSPTASTSHNASALSHASSISHNASTTPRSTISPSPSESTLDAASFRSALTGREAQPMSSSQASSLSSSQDQPMGESGSRDEPVRREERAPSRTSSTSSVTLPPSITSRRGTGAFGFGALPRPAPSRSASAGFPSALPQAPSSLPPAFPSNLPPSVSLRSPSRKRRSKSPDKVAALERDREREREREKERERERERDRRDVLADGAGNVPRRRRY